LRTPHTPTARHRDYDRGLDVVVTGDSDTSGDWDDSDSSTESSTTSVSSITSISSDERPPDSRKRPRVESAARPAAAGPPGRPRIPPLSDEERASLKDEKKDAPARDIPETDECVVCCIRARNTVFLECGHNAACLICVHKIENAAKAEGKEGKCPLCRQVYSCVVKYVKS
jgi:hypothetical protein